MSRPELAQEWQERFEDFKESEMTVQQWCDYNRTTVSQYYYWKQRLAALQLDKTAKPRFLALGSIPSPPISTPGAVTIRIAGAAIEVAAGFDPAILRAVVSALAVQTC